MIKVNLIFLIVNILGFELSDPRFLLFVLKELETIHVFLPQNLFASLRRLLQRECTGRSKAVHELRED